MDRDVTVDSGSLEDPELDCGVECDAGVEVDVE